MAYAVGRPKGPWGESQTYTIPKALEDAYNKRLSLLGTVDEGDHPISGDAVMEWARWEARVSTTLPVLRPVST